MIVNKKMCEENERSHADLFSERRESARGLNHAEYLRLHSVEEAAYMTQEILDRRAGKMPHRTKEEWKKRKMQMERIEDETEERRKGTGWWEAVRDKLEVFAERRWAECSERESQGAPLEEEEEQQNTEEDDR